MTEPIRAVLLDAGNTLIFVDPVRLMRVFREAGADVDPDRFREAEHLARLVLSERASQGDTGTESHIWHEYFGTLFRESGVPAEQMEEVGERVRRLHEEQHLWSHVNEDTEPALSLLKEEGYRLAVISNADGSVEGLLEATGLRPHLEFVMDSHVVGYEKPDPRIFLEGCRRLDLQPAECLYVGDLYPVDVVGARRAGLQAVLLDPLDRLVFDVDRIPSVAHLPAYLAERQVRLS